MGTETRIEWCHHTFNCWLGCSKVHAGCTNCYAETLMDSRYGKVKWGPHGTRVKTSESNWRQPLKWNRKAEKAGERRRVFCASLGDVFEDWDGPIVDSRGNELYECLGCHARYGFSKYRPLSSDCCKSAFMPIAMIDLRRDLFALIDQTPWLDWLLLTKRPENVRRMWPELFRTAIESERESSLDGPCEFVSSQYRENVWLGTSPCDQSTFDAACQEMAELSHLCPTLFLSLEPLLGPINFGHRLWYDDDYPASRFIDWVIVGGESGPGARPCNVCWIRSIIDQCKTAGVPVFVKQLGSNPWLDPGELERRRSEPGYVPLRDRKGGDLAEWPEDIRVREFPQPATVSR